MERCGREPHGSLYSFCAPAWGLDGRGRVVLVVAVVAVLVLLVQRAEHASGEEAGDDQDDEPQDDQHREDEVVGDLAPHRVVGDASDHGTDDDPDDGQHPLQSRLRPAQERARLDHHDRLRGRGGGRDGRRHGGRRVGRRRGGDRRCRDGHERVVDLGRGRGRVTGDTVGLGQVVVAVLRLVLVLLLRRANERGGGGEVVDQLLVGGGLLLEEALLLRVVLRLEGASGGETSFDLFDDVVDGHVVPSSLLFFRVGKREPM